MADLETLRLSNVRVFFTAAELQMLDQKRGFHGRADWLRSAGLGRELAAAPSDRWVTTWAESARTAANLTQLNNFVHSLNTAQMDAGQVAAVNLFIAELSATSKILAEFRANLGGAKSARAAK